MNSLLVIAVFTLLSGIGDALGFIFASRVWRNGEFAWLEALKSACSFQFGVAMYWFALKGLASRGVVAVETQTIFWFGVTIIGVALLSRQTFRWPLLDQCVAIVVLAGIGWLLTRTAH